jgi:hypothetical protein
MNSAQPKSNFNPMNNEDRQTVSFGGYPNSSYSKQLK